MLSLQPLNVWHRKIDWAGPITTAEQHVSNNYASRFRVLHQIYMPMRVCCLIGDHLGDIMGHRFCGNLCPPTPMLLLGNPCCYVPSPTNMGGLQSSMPSKVPMCEHDCRRTCQTRKADKLCQSATWRLEPSRKPARLLSARICD